MTRSGIAVGLGKPISDDLIDCTGFPLVCGSGEDGSVEKERDKENVGKVFHKRKREKIVEERREINKRIKNCQKRIIFGSINGRYLKW